MGNNVDSRSDATVGVDGTRHTLVAPGDSHDRWARPPPRERRGKRSVALAMAVLLAVPSTLGMVDTVALTEPAEATDRSTRRELPGAERLGTTSTSARAPSQTWVACPPGGHANGARRIQVASSIASNVRSLLAAAAAKGRKLCGWGYRDTRRQIELRRRNCGTSSYAIYRMPSSRCSPPTARPGTSRHEQGLAIDFTCNGRAIGQRAWTDFCVLWLRKYAARFGLRPLASEAWHWSTDGH
jgi:hypothetical protein